MTTLTLDPKIRKRVRSTLRALCPDPAKTLRSLGHKGVLGSPYLCPVTSYLRAHFPGHIIAVGYKFAHVNYVNVNLPPPVKAFVRELDAGLHPEFFESAL